MNDLSSSEERRACATARPVGVSVSISSVSEGNLDTTGAEVVAHRYQIAQAAAHPVKLAHNQRVADRKGAAAAIRKGFEITGTPGILTRAAQRAFSISRAPSPSSSARIFIIARNCSTSF
jgi:hypothetical protein